MKAITPNANSENDLHQREQSRVENGCDGSASLTTRVRGKAPALWSGTKRHHRSGRSDECPKYIGDADRSANACCGISLEPYPAFVEAIQHLDARNRIVRSLRLEDRAPPLARNRLGANRPREQTRERRGDLSLRHRAGAFELNHAFADPCLL